MKAKWILFWLGALVMVALWISTPYLANEYVQSRVKTPEPKERPLLIFASSENVEKEANVDLSQTGTLGDTFGALTSLFSVVTTVLLVAGLIMQHQEIKDLRTAAQEERERQKRKHWPLIILTSYNPPIVSNDRPADNYGTTVRYFLRVVNLGSTVTDVEGILPEQSGKNFRFVSNFNEQDLIQGMQHEFCIEYLSPDTSGDLCIVFTFLTLEGDQGAVSFKNIGGGKFVRQSIDVPFHLNRHFGHFQ